MERERLEKYSYCKILPVDSVAGSVSDPDPESGSGPGRAKMTQKNRKSKEISCFEELEVLFLGLKASSVSWTSLWRPRGK